jgi:hypothetical protein
MTDLEVVVDAITRFASLELKPLIGGSFASSVWGRPRQTHDLDITVPIRRVHISAIVQAFEQDYMVNLTELETALDDRRWPSNFQLLHYDSTFKIDVFLSEDKHYDRLVEERAKSVELVPGKQVWYVSAEDIVLMKLRGYDLGNRISDRQWNDLVQVIEVQGSAFDREYLLHWAERFELRDLALEALSEARP